MRIHEGPERGICRTCGFLCSTLMDHGGRKPIYLEIPEDARESGILFGMSGRDARFAISHPECYRRAFDIEAEFRATIDSGNDLQTAALAVLTNERNCKGWVQYHPGLDAVRHWDMWFMIELERDRRKWERLIERDRKRWERRLETDRRAFEVGMNQRREEADRKTNRIMIGLGLAALFFAAVQVLTANNESFLAKMLAGLGRAVSGY